MKTATMTWKNTRTHGGELVQNAYYAEANDCRLDVWFEDNGGWCWSVVYPEGETGTGYGADDLMEAKGLAIENMEAFLAGVI